MYMYDLEVRTSCHLKVLINYRVSQTCKLIVICAIHIRLYNYQKMSPLEDSFSYNYWTVVGNTRVAS